MTVRHRVDSIKYSPKKLAKSFAQQYGLDAEDVGKKVAEDTTSAKTAADSVQEQMDALTSAFATEEASTDA